MQIAHRLDVVLLVLLQLLLQQVKLAEQHLYLYVERRDVVSDGVDGATLALNLAIQSHEVPQALLHILLIAVQTAFLFLDLLLNLLALLLQGLNGSGGLLALGFWLLTFDLRLLTCGLRPLTFDL